MPMETKKRRSKNRNQQTQENSQNGRSDQSENEKMDRGDNKFYPTSSHRGLRDVEGNGGAKGQPRGRQSSPGNKSEPEKGAHPKDDGDRMGPETEKR